MLAIGIDPGTAICGFGLVEMVGNKLTPIHYGAVFTDKDKMCIRDRREQLEEVLETLTVREKKVLELRFGLEDGRSRTLEAVSYTHLIRNRIK